jgi:hypothetical protein
VRQKKAVAVFPRPTAGPLRPVVHSQTLKYNSKIRAGRGFTLEELKVLFSLWHKACRVLFFVVTSVTMLGWLRTCPGYESRGFCWVFDGLQERAPCFCFT